MELLNNTITIIHEYENKKARKRKEFVTSVLLLFCTIVAFVCHTLTWSPTLLDDVLIQNNETGRDNEETIFASFKSRAFQFGPQFIELHIHCFYFATNLFAFVLSYNLFRLSQSFQKELLLTGRNINQIPPTCIYNRAMGKFPEERIADEPLSYLKIFFNFCYYILISPIRFTWDNKTKQYYAVSNKIYMVPCICYHVLFIFINIITVKLMVLSWDSFYSTSESPSLLTHIFSVVATIASVCMASLFQHSLWFRKHDIVKLLNNTIIPEYENPKARKKKEFGVETYRCVKRKIEAVSKLLSTQILCTYIIVVTCYCQLPEILRMGQSPIQLHPYFVTNASFFIVAAEFHSSIHQAIVKWVEECFYIISQKHGESSNTNFVLENQMKLMDIKHDLQMNPIALSCRFFVVTNNFLSSVPCICYHVLFACINFMSLKLVVFSWDSVYSTSESPSLLTQIFSIVSTIASVYMTSSFQRSLWFRKQDIAKLLNNTIIREYRNKKARKRKEFGTSVLILICTSVAYVCHSYTPTFFDQLLVQNNETRRDNEETTFASFKSKVFQFAPRFIEIHIHSFYFATNLFAFVLSYSLLTLSKSFRKELFQTGRNNSQGVEVYRCVKRKIETVSKLFSAQILCIYIIVVTYYCQLPETVRMGLSPIQFFPYFVINASFFIVAAEFHSSIHQTVFKWVEECFFMTKQKHGGSSNTNFVLENQMKLMAIKHDLQMNPIALSCRFFIVTNNFLSSTYVALGTFTTLMFIVKWNNAFIYFNPSKLSLLENSIQFPLKNLLRLGMKIVLVYACTFYQFAKAILTILSLVLRQVGKEFERQFENTTDRSLCIGKVGF
ncbi:unnamed protein product [Orchesella dallaii]|uniref:Uncharacterized protein n=1 Tax=Orchesella dallaii TaxID=48710 RepID=A0ABP1REW6_9HEXA